MHAKTTAGAFRFVRMQSVLMLPACCHSCTPIAHAAPVLMFFNSNYMKKKYEMSSKFTLTYINLSTIYVHESICAQEPCICAQEQHSVDIHLHARIHMYTVHTYKCIHNESIHMYICVYRIQIKRGKQTLWSMCLPQHIYPHILLKQTACVFANAARTLS